MTCAKDNYETTMDGEELKRRRWLVRCPGGDAEARAEHRVCPKCAWKPLERLEGTVARANTRTHYCTARQKVMRCGNTKCPAS